MPLPLRMLAALALLAMLPQCAAPHAARTGLHQVAEITVGNNAGILAFGYGSAWVPNSSDGTVSRVDLSTNRVTAVIRIGDYSTFHAAGCDKYGSIHSYMVTAWSLRQCDQPTGIATGAGLVWVTRNQDKTIVAIDPKTDRIRATVPLPTTPFQLASDGRELWVTSFPDRAVAVIDEGTRHLITVLDHLPQGTTGITIVDGAAWVVSSYDDAVTRIDTSTHEVSGTGALSCVPACYSELKPLAIAPAFGYLWVRDEGNGTLARVDPKTLAVTYFSVSSFWGRDGLDSIASYSGALWVGGLELQEVGRNDRVVKRYPWSASVISSGSGSLWFTNDQGRLVRAVS